MISSVLIGVGLLLVVIGTVGIIRFSDVYSRMQASSVSDNAGLGLILLGLIVRGGFEKYDSILILFLLLLLLTNPITSHSIAQSAFTQPQADPEEEEQ